MTRPSQTISELPFLEVCLSVDGGQKCMTIVRHALADAAKVDVAMTKLGCQVFVM
jgi:hypothetical protein